MERSKYNDYQGIEYLETFTEYEETPRRLLLLFVLHHHHH